MANIDRSGDQQKAQSLYKDALALANTLNDTKAIASIQKVMSGSATEANFSSASDLRQERTKEGAEQFENKLVNHIKSSPERRSSEGIGLVDVPKQSSQVEIAADR